MKVRLCAIPVATQAERAGQCGGIVEKACVENKTACVDGHAPAGRVRPAAFETCGGATVVQAQWHAHKIEVHGFFTRVPTSGLNNNLTVCIAGASTTITTMTVLRWMPHSRLTMHWSSLTFDYESVCLAVAVALMRPGGRISCVLHGTCNQRYPFPC